ncbi:hypothetical protein R1sor_012638 [Riccia sorocarpa]|uniref:Reverse transcriptase domain-containing protein n=1 Tax=Riccia sorocarpa TaxID=122646 RepID=A0ABD3I8C8_9MARC
MTRGVGAQRLQGSQNVPSLPIFTGANLNETNECHLPPAEKDNGLSSETSREEQEGVHSINQTVPPNQLPDMTIGARAGNMAGIFPARHGSRSYNGENMVMRQVVHISDEDSTSFSANSVEDEARRLQLDVGKRNQTEGRTTESIRIGEIQTQGLQQVPADPYSTHDRFVFAASRADGHVRDSHQATRRQEASQKKRKVFATQRTTTSEPLFDLNLPTRGVFGPLGQNESRWRLLLLSTWNVGGLHVPHRRKRGVALIYHHSCQLLEFGEDSEGRWAWGKFSFLGSEVHAVSVYAPNTAEDRIIFWNRLRESLPSRNWIMAGDWNSVEFPSDSPSRSNQQGNEKSAEFQLLCSSFALTDARHTAFKRIGPRFSRAQWREGRLLWSRIDRVYAADFVIQKTEHHDAFWASDHIPVSVSTQWGTRLDSIQMGPRSAYFKADPMIVSENIEYLKTKWQGLELEYQDRDDAVKFLLCWSGIRKHIKTLQYEKAQRLQQLSEKESRLQKLSSKPQSQLTKENWGVLSRKFENFRPGSTIRAEVMITLWPVINGTFSRAAIHFWEMGRLSPAFKEGLLFLIPKGEDPATLREWRPIALLNTIYKVLAKLFALRLAIGLPAVVPANQHGFIRGRSTQNCILTFALVHEALKTRGRSDLFVALDQEKAYDRLQPDFLWDIMVKMEFSTTSINKIKALQENAETKILINGELLPTFQVEMGIRQGCPLSPLLYAIATVVIH